MAELVEQGGEERRTSGSSSTTRIRAAGARAASAAAASARLRLPAAAGLDIGQEQPDDRPLAFAAVDPHRPAGLQGDAVDLGEAEAGALADRLGGEERLGGARATSAGMPTPVSATVMQT